MKTLTHSVQSGGHGEIPSTFAVGTPAGQKRRTIYTEQNSTALPGKLVRGEGEPKTKAIGFIGKEDDGVA